MFSPARALRHLIPALALLIVGTVVGAADAGARPWRSSTPGTVVSVAPLKRSIWIPGTVSRAYRLTYVTTDVHGSPALSSGELFVPKGRAPAGGWPVISWAHGTSGLGDGCAPSLVGPAEPHRDFPVLAGWMRQGYAIVASDYVGLGTAGLPAYLNGRSEAHNIVDVVKAGRGFARAHLDSAHQLSRRWAVVGQSQGAGAAIYTARYATSFGGRGLDYLGAVGTGTPALIERIVEPIGPGFPVLPPVTTAYLAYIFAGLRSAYPHSGLEGILTASGRRYLKDAATQCINDFPNELGGVAIGNFFTRAVNTIPGFDALVESYLKMPESGFDKPFFMAHGRKDTDVPYSITLEYVHRLQANHQPVTFRTYDTDHSGTLIASQPAAHAFLRRLFSHR